MAALMGRTATPPSIWTTNIPSHSGRLVVVSIVFTAITTLVFIFRQIWRWTHRQRGVDDIFAALAYLVLLAQTIFAGLAAHYGLGKHLVDVRSTYKEALFYFYLYQIFYKVLGGLTKLTFCFLYLRLFAQPTFRRLVWAVAGVVSSGAIAFAITNIFQCLPVHRVWDPSIHGSCYDIRAFWFSHAAFNATFDIVVYVLPIPFISRLKISRSKKAGVIAIFAFGAFVIAAAIVRMIMLKGASKAHDPTWGTVNALIWTEIEANVAVICCCLPALHAPVLKTLRITKRKSKSSLVAPAPMVGLAPPLEINARSRQDATWDGGHQSHVEISVGPPPRCYINDAKNSKHSSTRSSWYGKVTREKIAKTLSWNSVDDSWSRVSSTELRPPPPLQGIFRTTDINVRMSTSAMPEDFPLDCKVEDASYLA
ncbi:hypothetical protein K431DRAFT_268668 [Polychaeton citri CBS 116435]|uniref:Rhodopsin domain-containing protein n=1 Tax=Polychaeton citri CBS 116435 TaxID=1314669 RepID=A0A9P4QAU5_9PEZI|nr:hypothetical protein K431DRAFT_268668 [Polychaeton citri CBS 116435]